MKLTLEQINKIPDVEVRERLKQDIIAGYENQKAVAARQDFLTFVKRMWPQFIEGKHHKEVSEKFNKIASGELTRLIINMPPRHTKSEFASYFLPAWMIGNYPELKIIQATHTAELAVNFGRKTKNLIDSESYQKLFTTRLQEDSKAAGRWNTSKGGEYFAVGVQGAVTGRGADLLIIDDPHSEQDVNSPNAFEKTYEWYTSGPRQRLQPGGRIILVMTRWSKKDLTQMLLNAQREEKADQWEVIEFPAIMPSGQPMWPQYWKLEDLEAVKASAGVNKWNAPYMQNPTSDEGAIIKREWWVDWPHEEMPMIQHVIQSYDTAFLKKQTADYSAITTWGVFRETEDSPQSLILLDSLKGRYEFPELKRLAYDQYLYWKPETILVEAKAAGLPLIAELRRQGLPVADYSPNRGQDKHARVNSVAPMFESGRIYAPKEREFAQEVIEECAEFPYGDHDDLVDSTTQAIMRFRDGGLIMHPVDYKEEPLIKPRYKYYW